METDKNQNIIESLKSLKAEISEMRREIDEHSKRDRKKIKELEVALKEVYARNRELTKQHRTSSLSDGKSGRKS